MVIVEWAWRCESLVVEAWCEWWQRLAGSLTIAMRLLCFFPLLSWLAQKTCGLPRWHIYLHAAGCTPSEAQAPVPSSTLFPLDLARPSEGHPLPPPVPYWTRSPSRLHFFIFMESSRRLLTYPILEVSSRTGEWMQKPHRTVIGPLPNGCGTLSECRVSGPWHTSIICS